MHGRNSLFIRFALALLCATALGLLALTARAADPIKIGYVGGISGPCGGLTHSAIKAMKIALAEINAAGGAAGRQIEIIWRDSKTKPDEGAKQARDLILTEKVDLLTGVCFEFGVHGDQSGLEAVWRPAVQRD